MARKTFPWLCVVAVIALLVAAGAAPGVQAQGDPPPMPKLIDGLFYGSDILGDSDYVIPYDLYAESPPLEEGGRTRGSVYTYDQDGWLYVAVVIDRSVNDNVYEPVPGGTYIQSAGWTDPHPLDRLTGSEVMTFTIICDGVTGPVSMWKQDYAYNPNGEWLSDVNGDDGDIGDAPNSLVSSSSLAWNLNNTTWPFPSQRSPDVKGTGVVTDEIGYPPLSTQPDDNITFETTVGWEWPVVYELAFYYTDICDISTMDDFELGITSHNSPSKDGEDDVPLAVELLSFTGKAGNRAAVLSWETASEIDNVGFNLYRAEDIHGERVKLNAELIATSVPPGSPSGAAYSYTDMRLAHGTTYYYWLEDVDITGRTELHGPVQVSLSGRPGLRELLRRVLP